jgi:hypothetical protein
MLACMRWTRRDVLGAAALLSQNRPLSFAAIADVQYADKDSAGPRDYRKSIHKLRECRQILAREDLAFTVQLGDLIDEGTQNLETILPVFEDLPGRKRHIVGNHDCAIGHSAFLSRMRLPRGYESFSLAGWRFLILDGMDASVATGEGIAMRERLLAAGAANAQVWNGGIGAAQMQWLAGELKTPLRVGMFCHFPILDQACRPDHRLWNYAEVLSLIENAGCVRFWMCGHDHRGGYAHHNGIHHVTLKGLVEHDAAQACSVADLYSDRLILRTLAERRELPLG